MKTEVLVVGASNTDISGESFSSIIRGDSNIGKVMMSPGGVGHNIALNIALAGHNVKFITAIGNDSFGKMMESHLREHLDISDALFAKTGSGVYLCVNDRDGDMYVAVNDMEINDLINPSFLETKKSVIESAPIVIVDTNLSEDAIRYVCETARGLVMADCVSTLKADRLRSSLCHISVLKPNLMELSFLSGIDVVDESSFNDACDVLFRSGVKALLVTSGIKGACYVTPEEHYYVPCIRTEVVNTTGAGDSFLGGFAAGLIETGLPSEAIRYAVAASALTVASPHTVCPVITGELIKIKKEEIETDDKISGLFS